MIGIKSIGAASNEMWDAAWAGCPYATYFHSREWAEIWQTYSKGRLRPVPKVVTFSDGVKAVLPLSYQNRKGARNYYLSAEGCFGGWIAQETLSAIHAELMIENILGLPNIVWRINPFDRLLVDRISHIGRVYSIEEDVTHVIPLSPEGATVSLSAQRKARKSAGQGVSVDRADSEQDWREYYKVYRDSIRRWGPLALSSYGWELFDDIRRRKSPYASLWLAKKDGQIIAGALCFYAKCHAVYWHGAALEDQLPTRPVNLLLYEALKQAAADGYQWFDLNPSGGLEGVKAFKKSLGAVELSCPVIYQKSRFVRFYVSLKRVAGLWR
jgi:hypothetical protein